MRDKKLQVFVSSTYTDLKEERQAAVEAILSAGHIPAGMELFSAGDETQMAVIKRWIDESDVYLLILGGKYGSVDKKTGKSYTQLEYEYAVDKGKPLFAVVISDKGLKKKVEALNVDAIERENNKELNLFREAVLSKMVRFWEDVKDIKLAIHETLSEFSYSKDLVGWVRGDNLINSNLLAEEIAKLTKENAELRGKLADIASYEGLYFGLTFGQLKKLLLNELVETSGELFNLYHIIIENGESLINWQLDSSQENENIISKLLKFKMIRSSLAETTYVMGQLPEIYYGFTEVGHNFYLKALAIDDSYARIKEIEQ